MSFLEERLELGIDYGTVTELSFSTTLTSDGAGGEQRISNWAHPVGRWQLGNRSVLSEELDYLQAFHRQTKGAAVGFRFRDWGDYQARGQSLTFSWEEGGATKYQLYKTYTLSYTAEGTTVTHVVRRPILKPVLDSVVIYVSGEVVTEGVALNPATGVVTFAEPPGGAVTADFEFDVPVRFERDVLEFRFIAFEQGRGVGLYQLGDLSLVELRLTPSHPFPLDALPSGGRLLYPLPLGYDYGTVGGPEFNTTINTVGAGFEERSSNWTNPKGSFNVGDRTLTRPELNYFLTLFRVCRGAATAFDFFDWQTQNLIKARFGDKFSYRFDAMRGEEAIFYLSGLEVVRLQASKVHVFGSFQTKGGPWDGSAYICNGGCDNRLYFRTILPVENFQGEELLEFEVYNGQWFVKNLADDVRYQVDFIYANNFLVRDTSTYRGFPQGPFSPHGIGIDYVPAADPCVQTGFSSPAKGDNLEIIDLREV